MKRLLYVFRGFRHFLVSNSRHGTHSPFVYNLAEQVIYKKQDKKDIRGRMDNYLMNEIADYFGVVYTWSQQEVGKTNALYIENAVTTVDELATLQYKFHYIVLAGIYNGKKDRQRWRKVCQDKRFVVTIDLFFFGLIFYRREQPKQNFKLRFPFWKYL